MQVKTLGKLKGISGKRVLVRVDFNVPLKNGKIAEKYKIEKSLPTIGWLIKKGARVILISHLGRPKGEDKKLSLKPVAGALAKMLDKKVNFFPVSDKIIGDNKHLENLRKKIDALKKGDVALLENIRFMKGEEKNDAKTAKALASLGDLFVLDGFAVAHRDSASVTGIAKFLPACAGLLMEEEIKGLAKVLDKPKKPFVVILGGLKMETKIPLVKKLLAKATNILLGGGIANTCFFAKGLKIGGSAAEKEFKKIAGSYLKNKKIILPVDVIVGGSGGQKAKAVDIDSKFKITDSKFGIYDIGPKTISLYAKYIKKANTLVWNGAAGKFEQHPYQFGSYSIARLMGARSKGKAFGVSGGGETVELLKKLQLMNEVDLVSTGGGAMLEFLSGKRLPGVNAVCKK